MPTRKKPTYLKRQKELQRVARANEKREARRARKHAANLGIIEDPETLDPGAPEDTDSAPSLEDAPDSEG